MRSGDLEYLLVILVLGVAVYAAFRFYWTRVLGCAAILAVWAGVALATPVYVAVRAVDRGDLVLAVITLMASVAIAIPWFLAASAAKQWVAREIRIG